MHRRDFLKGSIASLGIVTFCRGVNAETQMTGWLSGFRDQQGRYGVAQIDPELNTTPLFYTPLRLHGIYKHPTKNIIVAPSRRPDMQMFVFDLATKTVRTIPAAPGRHFYGHGSFSADGHLYYTTESAYDDETGVIGIYDVQQDFRRVGEWDSGGIGPHEIKRYKDKLFIANGGILTHPDLGRAKLNINEMAPSLTMIDLQTGHIENEWVLPKELHQLSIRHLDMSNDGTVFIGLQDQLKHRLDVPLVWKATSNTLIPMEEPQEGWKIFKGYIGSVSSNDTHVCVSSPRGNCLFIWGQENSLLNQPDVCGIAPSPKGGFLFTSGQGFILEGSKARKQPVNFDNHCHQIT